MMPTSRAKAIIFLEEIQKQFLIKRFGASYLEKFNQIQQTTNNPEAFVNFARKVLKDEVDPIEITDLYNKINISDRLISTKYDMVTSSFLLEGLFIKIMEAAKEIKLSNSQIPYIGTVLSDQYNAFACRIPETDQTIILLDSELFLLASILSKIITLSLPEFKSFEKTIQFSTDKNKIEKHINENPEIIYRFKLLVYDYFYKKRAMKYFEPDKIFTHFRYNLINSLELFIVGHEYGHIISGHLAQSIAQIFNVNNIDFIKINPNWENEYEADEIGIKLMLKAIETCGQLPFCYVGADLFFTFLDVHERALSLFSTGKDCSFINSNSHPPTTARREKIKNHIKLNMPEKNIFIYNEFTKFIENVIEILWNKIKENAYCLYSQFKL